MPGIGQSTGNKYRTSQINFNSPNGIKITNKTRRFKEPYTYTLRKCVILHATHVK